ncbi:hypothetical protein FRB94_006346 [Tulasnella sp. JGI-2019a]|nr:hypothetical protein FRB94_006346 [Tulasnella sp. JGI-2019a]KAG9007271.1 hypothetical protein FRB93_008094 [Tulasnella sp. JGI-2019a]KAG9033579.1 hypothetical protein FRB95_014657 [Tulasnella sp. JGI-2019a]
MHKAGLVCRALTFSNPFLLKTPIHMSSAKDAPNSASSIRGEWTSALDDLPPITEGQRRIPAFFFAHGSPLLLSNKKSGGPFSAVMELQGPRSPLAAFLTDFGPHLLRKYEPKAIVVFSAHWETNGETLVTDYGNDNPLLYDYYGFEKELYQVSFKSHGDSATSKRVVDLLRKAGISARTTPKEEARGRDGRGFMGPGLDHGVFVPFKLMFGDATNVPIVQVSIDGSLSPETNWALGKALDELRSQGVLILSGGLTIHTFQDMSAWAEKTANARVRGFHSAIIDAVRSSPGSLKSSLCSLNKVPGFREAHPREEHFVPIYVAAGAGEEGSARVINSQYGAATFAFGV